MKFHHSNSLMPKSPIYHQWIVYHKFEHIPCQIANSSHGVGVTRRVSPGFKSDREETFYINIISSNVRKGKIA